MDGTVRTGSFGIAAALLAAPSYAAVIYAQSASPPVQDGTSWCTAYADLQDALAAAQPGDEVRVAAGIYRPDRGTGDRSASFALKNGVTLLGGYAGCGAADPDARDPSVHVSILSGDLNGDDTLLTSQPECEGAGGTWYNVSFPFCDRILNNDENSFHVVVSLNNDATTVLDGFTVSGGNANGPGLGPTPDSEEQGAGINVYNGTPVIRRCTFENNRCDNHGAAINDHGGATIDDCEFRGNFSIRWGGALHNHTGFTTTITDSRFIKNATAGMAGGGGAIFAKGTLDLGGCRFESNFSATRGGAMYADAGSVLTARNCVFNKQDAENSGNTAILGGAVYLAASQATFHDTRFEENLAIGSIDDMKGRGGAVFALEGSTVVLENSSFVANRAVGNPGFLGDVEGGGGAVYAQAGTEVASHACVFEGNGNGRYGGAVWADGTIELSGCSFRGNHAPYGGAVRASVLRVTDCLFEDNRGRNLGGACLVNTIDATRCVFRRNVASPGTGGAIRIGNGFLDRCLFAANVATESGGAISIESLPSQPPLLVVNSAFVANQAGLVAYDPTRGAGGALANVMATIEFINSTFADNAAAVDGGAIHDQYGDLSFANCVLWHNSDRNGEIEASQISTRESAVALNHSLLQGLTGGFGGVNNIDQDPLFVRAPHDGGDGWGNENDDYGDLTLLHTSPCIDAGDNALLPPADAVDLAGNPRLVDHPLTPEAGGAPAPVVDMGAFEFGPDCHGNGVHDALDIARGDSFDSNVNGIPDECEVGPQPGTITPRYLLFTPLPPESLEPVALRITSPAHPCVDAYVQASGRLGVHPVYRTPAEWGAVAASDRAVTPETPYSVQILWPDGDVTEGVAITTARWGDTAGAPINGQWQPPDGLVSVSDVVACLDAFQHLPGGPPMESCDLDPEMPDGVVQILDIVRILDAFAGTPYPFAVPCP